MIDEAFLLAGGRGRRMGVDKRFIHLDGRPLYRVQAEKLASTFLHVTILCKAGEEERFQPAGLPVIGEADPESALLTGFISGLEHLEGERGFFLSVDLPLFPSEAICTFRDHPEKSRPVFPRVGGKIHAGVGILPKRLLPDLLNFKANGLYAVHSILEAIDPLLLDEADLPFLREAPDALFNLNKPEDLNLLQERIRKGGKHSGA